jgi:hypothetical protein
MAPSGDEMILAYEVNGIYSLPQDAEGIRSVLQRIVSSARGSNISEVHIAISRQIGTRWCDVKQVVGKLRALPLLVRLIADAAARESSASVGGRHEDVSSACAAWRASPTCRLARIASPTRFWRSGMQRPPCARCPVCAENLVRLIW